MQLATEVTEGNNELQSQNRLPRTSKTWIFTDYNLDLHIWEYIQKDVNRMRVGLEYTEQGQEHLQGVITFKRAWTKRSLMKQINGEDGCTWIPARAADFMLYVNPQKSAMLIDIDNSHQGKSSEFDMCIEDITKNNIDKLSMIKKYPKTYVMRHAGLDKLLGVYDVAPVRDHVCVRWFWGVSGGGKSHTAREEAGPHAWYCSDTTLQWFDTYNGQENVVINELSPHCNFERLLKICDKEPVTVPIKGSSVPWRAVNIWITKMEHPLELFKHLKVDLYQVTRRMNEIREFPNVYKND